MLRLLVLDQISGDYKIAMSFIKNFFVNLKSSINRTVATYIDEEYLENLEEELVRSDLGVKIAIDFVNSLRGLKITEAEVKTKFEEFLLKAFDKFAKDHNVFKLKVDKKQLNILLIVGVNGAGKTTSIGKLAHRFKSQGYKVLIAAGDTFRAAAEEQLNIWAKRAEVEIVQLEEGSKSSAVVYKAIEKAKAEDYNMLIIDTAGRLQNKINLMEELSKIKQVIDKNKPENALVETMMVLDASTGSNALSQAEKFMEASQLDSLILTKFDGTAKAGMVFAIAYNLKIPVKFIGTGEGIDDIEDFELSKFCEKYF